MFVNFIIIIIIFFKFINISDIWFIISLSLGLICTRVVLLKYSLPNNLFKGYGLLKADRTFQVF